MGEGGCLFCAIAAGDVAATVVRSQERVVAFRDIDPKAPVHVLVIPREHFPDAGSLAASDDGLFAELVRTAADIAAEEGLVETGYRLVANAGPDAGQSVPHLHLHLLGGRAMAWPPG